MNIYGKLAEARSQFHRLSLKKSGLNQFAGWKYFELGDFLIPGMQVMKDAGLCPVISFKTKLATMMIHDMESETHTPGVDFMLIDSPLSESHAKGNQPIQNVGMCETYSRRYLWMAALEIIEHDSIEQAEQVYETPAKPKVERPPQKKVTTSQLTVLQNLIKKDKLSPRRKAWVEKKAGEMTESDAATIIREAKMEQAE
jgi:hypothetical protein